MGPRLRLSALLAGVAVFLTLGWTLFNPSFVQRQVPQLLSPLGEPEVHAAIDRLRRWFQLTPLFVVAGPRLGLSMQS